MTLQLIYRPHVQRSLSQPAPFRLIFSFLPPDAPRGQLSVGVAVRGLDAGSEFVPVFCPDGSALEAGLTLFDAAGGVVRLMLQHSQPADRVFRLAIAAPFWVSRPSLG